MLSTTLQRQLDIEDMNTIYGGEDAEFGELYPGERKLPPGASIGLLVLLLPLSVFLWWVFFKLLNLVTGV